MEDLHFHFYSNLLVSRVFRDVDANRYTRLPTNVLISKLLLLCSLLLFFFGWGGGAIMFTVVYLGIWL